MNPIVYGVNSNSWVLKAGEVIEVVLVNLDEGHHPWQYAVSTVLSKRRAYTYSLHGHNFQVIARSDSGVAYDPTTIIVPKYPIRRDVMQVHAGGYLVMRFKADNPDKFICPKTQTK